MAVVASGTVGERPFARIVYSVAANQFSGDLILGHHGRSFRVCWRKGLVVAADSPLPSDSVVRVALTAGIVDSTQVGGIMATLSDNPGLTPLDVVANTAHLSEAHRQALARRALAQRAIRIFALSEASFELDNESRLSPDSGVQPIAVRTLIFRGLDSHYDESRLAREMTAVEGAGFQLASTDDSARARLAEYGFSDPGKACLRHLARAPMTLDALVSAVSQAERRYVMAVVYALLSCDDVVVKQPPRIQGSESWSGPIPARSPRASTEPESPASAPRDTGPEKHAPRQSGRPTRAPDRARNQSAEAETAELITARLHLLDDGCNHYQLMGVEPAADMGSVRRAYFALAKKLHPDQLRAAGITDDKREAHRLFAAINRAFATLGKADKRAQYDKYLAEGGTGDKRRDQARAEAEATRLMSAEEHFLRGEQALRANRFADAIDEFQRAVELNDQEADHHALLGWATWCHADDKQAVLNTVKKRLDQAISLSDRCVAAHYYRGQLASFQGDQNAALYYLRKVLKLQPSHREADLQARLIQSRLDKQTGKSKGRRRRS